MTTTNDWIKMSERKPTEADLPVWLVDPLCDGRGGNRALPVQMWMTTLPSLGSITHWRSAKADIPAPPKEQTQRERDIDAFEKFCEYTAAAQHSGACSPSWHAALAWERAEIAKLLDGVPVEDSYSEGYSKLRARLRP